VNRPAALLLPCLLVTAGDGFADSLTIVARAADAPVEPAVNGELSLPDLEIDTSIIATCADGQPPLALSLSSADSIRHIQPAADGANDRRELVFTLPADQVPPVLARDFCLENEASEEPPGDSGSTLVKRAFVSIRASMRCGTDGEDRLTSETALVDLTLVCRRGARQGTDQESSE
jgi:hypothetical protein